MDYTQAYLNTLFVLLMLHSAFMLSVEKMPLKGEVSGHALNSHGNNIVIMENHEKKIMEKSWNCVVEFLSEPCKYEDEEELMRPPSYNYFFHAQITKIKIHF